MSSGLGSVKRLYEGRSSANKFEGSSGVSIFDRRSSCTDTAWPRDCHKQTAVPRACPDSRTNNGPVRGVELPSSRSTTLCRFWWDFKNRPIATSERKVHCPLSVLDVLMYPAVMFVVIYEDPDTPQRHRVGAVLDAHHVDFEVTSGNHIQP